MLVGVEHGYAPIEKHCLALIFATKKLRHYMLAHQITLVSRVDPLKYLLTRPILTGRLAKWAVTLMEFDLTYASQKAIKGQALADFLAAHPLPSDSPLSIEFPDEETLQIHVNENQWKMYFDGSSSIRPATKPELPKVQAGIGLVFVTPDGGLIRHSLSLTEPRTNNEAEYEALIAGLEIALGAGVQRIKVYGDSQLVLSQIEGQYQTRKPELVKFNERALQLISQFEEVKLEKISRAMNGKADALAKLAKELSEPDQEEIQILVRQRRVLAPCFPNSQKEDENEESSFDEEEVHEIEEEPNEDWRQPFFDYFQQNKLPEDKSRREQIRKRLLRYAYVNNTLYWITHDHKRLRCITKKEAQKVMHEVHGGSCGAHQPGPAMEKQIKSMGYYWPSMIADCESHARRCHMCQVHGDLIHQHPNVLHPTVTSWPFEMWGTDIIGPIDPPSSKGHRFILATTDYFSKWAEAEAYREIKAADVIRFFKNRVLYRFGNPRKIISDNGTAFKNAKIYDFARKHKIEWRYSSIYNPRANGLAEAFNKTLIKILRKTVGKKQRDWHERLPEALWAYRITYRTPTQATPYSLVYGVEAVLPIEVELPSLRIAMSLEMPLEKKIRLRLEELDAMDEKGLEAQQKLELYQARMTRAYEKLSRPRSFRKGETVLVVRRPILGRHHGPKFSPNWEGPYVIDQVYDGGAYLLIDAEGNHPMPPINGRYLKKYYGQPRMHENESNQAQQEDIDYPWPP